MSKKLKRLVILLYFKICYNNKLIFDFTVKIGKSSIFEGMNKLHPNSSFEGYLGYGSYIGPDSNIIGKVGKFTSIAPNVSVNNGIHPFKAPFATTSPAFFSLRKQNGHTFANQQYFDELRFADNEKKYAVIIGNDCWIGQNVFISGGITIGDGAVILAGAIVTKNIPPYAIAGGVPAKVLDYRYDAVTIEQLLELEWWNKSIEWIRQNSNLLRDIETLKNNLDNK